VSAPAGNWVDIDGSPASVTINSSTASSGYVTITGFVGEPSTQSGFLLRTINLTAKAAAATGTTAVTGSVIDAFNKTAQPVTVTPRNLTVTIN
jgi:fluoride ion exporter CrcB/FEX